MRRLCVFVAAWAVFLFLGALMEGQQATRFGSEPQRLAREFLSSPLAGYLSATGRTALGHVAGQLPIFTNRPGVNLGSVDLFARPAATPLGEILVNNPDQDLGSFGDISTQSEPAVAGFGRVIVVAFNDSGQVSDNPFAPLTLMGYSRSIDGGLSFTDVGHFPPPPLGANFGDPGIVAARTGEFYASSIVVVPGGPGGSRQTIGVYRSTDGGLTWPLLTTPPPGTTPSFADKPFIAIDTSSSTFAGNVYLSWTSFGPPSQVAPSELPILFSRSTDKGVTFSPAIVLSDPGTINQGSEPVVGRNGEVYVSWLRLSPAPQLVMLTRSFDGGQTFDSPIAVAALTNIGFASGNLNGNFRVLSWPRLDVSPVNGNAYVVYATNPPGPDGADVLLTASTDRGLTWTSPVRLNTDSTQSDQFFPDVAVDGRGVVQVIWYDRRNDADNRLIDVYRARLTSDGRSVLENERLTSTSFPPAVGYDPVVSPVYMGDYIDIKALLGAEGRASSFAAAWGDNRRRIVTAGGQRHDQDVFFKRF